MNMAEIMGVDKEWANERRMDYLIERVSEYKTRIDMAKLQWEADIKDGTPLFERLTNWYLADVPTLEKKLKGYWKRLKFALSGQEWEISDEMIQQAREADINDFIDTDKRGFTHCLNPDHDDKNPSMYVKNGYAYCFSCGAKFDVIDVVMLKDNLTFAEAVKVITEGKL